MARVRRASAPVVGGEGAGVSGEVAVDRVGRQLGGPERAMEALAGERVEEPGRVADEQPAVARARRTTRLPTGAAPSSPSQIRGDAHGTGSSSAGGIAAIAADRRPRPRPSLAEPLAPATARQHDPDVDPAARAPARGRRSRRRT